MRVLVVDDEVALAASIADGLTGEGFAVDVVHDGREALWMATEGSFAAIVLDVMLPGANGFTVCRELRGAGVWTPVLMLTVRDAHEDEAGALDLGADDYLTKPFSFPVLVARVRALVRRPREPGTSPLAAGDLTLDLERRTCARGDRSVELSNREFALLHVLMERVGRVVTRDELRARVWGWQFDGNPGVLDVYVGYLRGKIDRPFDRHTIQTVRGVGYRLQPDA